MFNPSSFGAGATGFGGAAAGQAQPFGGTPSYTFGSNPTTSAFGGGAAVATPTPGFGSAQPTTNLPFGATQTQPTSFGVGMTGATTSPFAPKPGGLFSAQQTPTISAFGGGSQLTSGFGTTPTSFPGATTTSSFGMQQQQAKPLFGATTTGFNTPVTSTSGLFGAPTQTTGVFGAPTQTTGVFGAPTTTTFSSPQSAFGAASSGTGVFGSNPMMMARKGTGDPKYRMMQATDVQGASFLHTCVTGMPEYQGKSFEELRMEDYFKSQSGGAQPGASTSLFGGTPVMGTTSTLGASPTIGGGLFGATTATASPGVTSSLFGSQPQTVAPSPFGSSSFGSGGVASSSMFPTSSTTAVKPTFALPSTGGAFGQPTTQPTSAFGTSSAFGTTTPQTSPFQLSGAAAPTAAASPFGAGFGAATPATSSGLFSSGVPGTGTGTGSLFPNTGSILGATSTPATGTPAFNFGSSFGGAKPTTFVGNTTSVPSAFSFAPGASTPLFMNPTTTSTVPTSFNLPTQSTTTFFSPTSTAPVVPGQILQTTLTSQPFGSLPSFAPLTPPSKISTPPSPSTNALRPISHYRHTPRSTARLRPRALGQSLTVNAGEVDFSQVLSPDVFVPRNNIKKLVIEPESVVDDEIPVASTSLEHVSSGRIEATFDSPTPASPGPIELRAASLSPQLDREELTPPKSPNLSPCRPDPRKASFSHAPRLTVTEWILSPSLAELQQLSDKELASVENFEIVSPGLGSIRFLEAVDVRDIDLGTCVRFGVGEVVVFPDSMKKPPVGQGLNVPAEIMLEKCLPHKGGAARTKRYRQKILHATEEMGATLVSYSEDTGMWKFRVQHFSRYGVPMETSDSEEEEQDGTAYSAFHLFHPQIQKVEPKLSVSTSEELSVEEAMAVVESDEHTIYSDDSGSVVEATASEHSEDEKSEETPVFLPYSSARVPIQLGLNTERMQTMKWLFMETEHQEPLPTKDLSSDMDIFTSIAPFSTLSPVVSTSPPSLHSLPSSSVVSGRPTPVLSLPPLVFPLCRSLLAHHPCLAATVRSFRPGWGPGGLLVTLAPSKFRGRETPSLPYSTLCLRRLNPSQRLKQEDNASPYVPYLSAHLSHSCRRGTSAEVPPCWDLVQPLENVSAHIKTSIASVCGLWRLVLALWGNKGAAGGENLLAEVSSWLQESVKEATLKEIEVVGNDSMDALFLRLCSHRILEAKQQAISLRLHRLALLLSQCDSFSSMRSDLSTQVASWEFGTAAGAGATIDPALLRVYRLLAGRVTVPEVSRGLDWKRALGLQLWFAHSPSSPLIDSATAYNAAVSRKQASPPAAPYLKNIPDSIDFPRDTAWHLLCLRLRLGNPCGLATVVDPSVVLAAVGAVNAPDLLCLLGRYYAEQLEAEGLWHWAIYVLLCSPQEPGYDSESVVRELLARHCSCHSSFTEEEEFCVGTLGVPRNWVLMAKGYHFEDFACTHCGKQLAELLYRCMNKQPYCFDCFSALFC